MKRIVQDIRSGQLETIETPEPICLPDHVLIANAYSVISPGTERTIRKLAKKSLLGKAKERPDHVRRVVEKVRTEGFFQTIQQVRAKLSEPMSLGYSSSGVVLGCGSGVREFEPGDRVASNGPHSEVVCVPRNLCAAIPEGVRLEEAAFGVLGAIALQAVRLSGVQLGETCMVIGLGLIGQLSVALLRAAGCRVLGTDPDAVRCELAVRLGAEIAQPRVSPEQALGFSYGRGVDAVLVAASTQSSQPVDQAAASVRKKGVIVVVGAVGMELQRQPFYEKEIRFVVSCSYGPGRYDPTYEEKGIDYPPAFVRWTEQRNIQAVLELMAGGRLDVSPLISHRYPFEETASAYALVEGDEPSLAVVLSYPGRKESANPHSLQLSDNPTPSSGLHVGVIGAGNFARLVLLPILTKEPGIVLRTLCSAGGLSAAHIGRDLGFAVVTSDPFQVLHDTNIDTLFLLTPHNQHAQQVLEGLKNGKNVFVEKPLAISLPQLLELDAAVGRVSPGVVLTVGFNRRFSPAARYVKEFFSDVTTPLAIQYRFNAGHVPSDHWTQDETVGGGRIVGEACHAIDLVTHLVGDPPVRVFAESAFQCGAVPSSDDQCLMSFKHGNGSVSSVTYVSSGDRAFGKERVEIFGGGRIAVIDDYRTVTTVMRGKRKRRRFKGKGHQEEIAEFARCVAEGGGSWPIPWEHLYTVTLAALLAVRSLREGRPFDVARGIVDHSG